MSSRNSSKLHSGGVIDRNRTGSQTTQRTGYLGTCADNGSISGYDSWAGMLGEPLDRLQIHINDNSKY